VPVLVLVLVLVPVLVLMLVLVLVLMLVLVLVLVPVPVSRFVRSFDLRYRPERRALKAPLSDENSTVRAQYYFRTERRSVSDER